MNDKDQKREQRQGGIFDKKPDTAPQPPPAKSPKEDFHEPSVSDIQGKAAVRKPLSESDQYQEQAADKINQAMSGGGMYNDDDIKIDENDLKLAEKLIFDGYAEIDVDLTNFPEHKFTICSTSAEELSIMDEVLFDYVKIKEKTDGTIDMPQNHISTMRSALFLALGYRGRDKEELCEEPTERLNTIKKAARRVTDLEIAGKMEEAVSLRKSLKKALFARGLRVKRMSTQMIDFLSDEKYKFDRKMYKIMTMKEVVPKS